MPLPPVPTKKAARITSTYIEAAPKASPPQPFQLRDLVTVTKVTPKEPSKAPIVASPNLRELVPATTNQTKGSAAPANEGQNTPRTKAKSKRAKTGRVKRLFVLDTNVLMHDPLCLFRFEEHDIFLPMVVLEELDSNKRGMSEVARNARQTSRTLDALAAVTSDIAEGLSLDAIGHQNAGGKLFFQTTTLDARLPQSLPQGKADNQILGVVQALSDNEKTREVVLVSKDINMRVKARALGLAAEDYENDKTLDDGELLYPGALELPADFWSKQSKKVESWQEGSYTFYRISGAIVQQFYINQFVYFEIPGEPSLYARVTEIRDKSAVLKTLRDFGHQKNAAWGVTSRNR